jgi:hypothetical protein
MSATRARTDGNTKSRLFKLAITDHGAREQAEELLEEIDNLALLLHEVRKQTDRIEAAADAIGDSILSRLATETRLNAARVTRRALMPANARAAARLRVVPAANTDAQG